MRTLLADRRAQSRDVAVVLSGGGVNGVLMELGFLKRIRETGLWPRIGWIFGTSAGALAGTMAALDRLDDLERFLYDLRAEEAFRPNRLWRLPLLGMHDYALPQTIADRVGDTVELAAQLREAPVELVVVATDVSADEDPHRSDELELAYSAWTTDPEVFASAVLASAAISGLVLPLRVGDRIATDGGWVRNYPLGYAYDHPEVELILAFRYLPRYPRVGVEPLQRLRRRLERLPRVPPLRALIAELREAEERAARGEPAHAGDMILRLMRTSVVRNSALEERFADEKDRSIAELASLRTDVLALVDRSVRGGRRDRLRSAIDERFGVARFPFRHDRLVPRITVSCSVADVSLDPGFRTQKEWTPEAKRSLIERGYRLTDRALRGSEEQAAAAAGS
jgi:predicted acylesterase/phospholipase RssA